MLITHHKQYRYCAFDITGAKIHGSICASSTSHARQKLLSNAIIAKRVYRQMVPSLLFSDARVTRTQLATLFEILGLLIKSGTSLIQSVSLLYEQAGNAAQKEIIYAWYKETLNGKSLADTLRDTSTPISNKLMLEVADSELSGQLGRILLDLSKSMKHHEKIKTNVKLTLVCSFVLVTAGIVFIY